MRVTRLDLTSTYTDLSFEGFVEISQDGEAVIYRFPTFTIDFIPASADATKHIRLDTFAVLVARNPSEMSIRNGVPISQALDAENTHHILSNIEFRLPKHAIVGSKYVKFSVDGEVTTKLVGETWLFPVEKTARAAWPISAESNRWIVPTGDPDRPQIRYKTPADPDDPCAPERIH